MPLTLGLRAPVATGFATAGAAATAKAPQRVQMAFGGAASPQRVSIRTTPRVQAVAAGSEPPAAASASGTIVEAALANPDFSILAQAVVKAELAEALSGDGPFTVFAPKNSAFASFVDDVGLSRSQLLDSDDKLVKLLTHHVVPGKVMSSDLSDGMEAETLSGRKLAVSLEGGARVNGVKIVQADIEVGNGVIHVVEEVVRAPFTFPAPLQAPSDIGGFKGWMPEVVNGRAAQIGFLLAIVGEVSTHEAFLSQLGGNFGAAAKCAAVITFASIVPSMHSSIGYTANPTTIAGSREWQEAFKGGFVPKLLPVFTPEAEQLNGRAAMVGLLALALIETFTGGALL